jgi:cytochrome c oxidase subunit 4
MSGSAHAHPTPRDYWVIALVLAVITAVEVAVAYLDADAIVVPALIVLASAKFFLVVAWYMHLRFESKTYRRLFYIGLVAAPILFGAVLLTFGVLIGS